MTRHTAVPLWFALVACDGMAPATVDPKPTPVSETSVAAEELGVASRLSRGRRESLECKRVEQRAAELKQSLAALHAVAPEVGLRLRPLIVKWATSVREANPETMGELHRVYRTALDDGQVSAAELVFLVETLELNLRLAYAGESSRRAFEPAFIMLEDDVAVRPEVAAAAAPVVLELGELLASLAECAP